MHKEEINILVGTRVQKLRKNKKETQEELGNSVELSQKAISNIENGRNPLNIRTQIKLAEHFNVSHDFLITGKDSKSILSTICDNISIVYKTISNGENSYEIPFLEINSKLLDYLIQHANIKNTNRMPDDIKAMWFDRINENFYNDCKNIKSSTIELVPLPAQMIYPDDNKKHWKQSDLIRELNFNLNKLIK